MSSYISNSFSVSVNRPTTGTIEPVSTVNIYKNEKMLQAVNHTPGDGEYKVIITNTTNCSASIKSDNKTILLNSVSGNNGTIEISVNIENKKTYSKTISVANVNDTSVLSSNFSRIEQTANKISWLVKSGTSSSNMTLTDEALDIISKNINITGTVTFSSLDSYTQNRINNSYDLTSSWQYGGTTTINGAKIQTGTITADQISANAIKGKNITGGTINIGSGTFTVNKNGQIIARTEPNEKGQYLEMNSSSYKIFNGSKTVAMTIGFRDLDFENGNVSTSSPSIFLGADGINIDGGTSYTAGTGRYYGRIFATDSKTSMTNTHVGVPMMEMNFNTRYTDSDTNHPIASQLRFFGDGDIVLAPVCDFQIRTHQKDNQVTKGGSEYEIAYFASSGSPSYASFMRAQAITSNFNAKGLFLGDYYMSANGNGYDSSIGDFISAVFVKAGKTNSGAKMRTFRPHADNVMILGSGSYRWSKLYCGSSSINTSDRRCKTNINYLTSDNARVASKPLFDENEIWNFVKDIDFATYNFIDNETGGAKEDNQIGFILQDLIQAYPDLTNSLLLDKGSYDIEEGEDDTIVPMLGYNSGNYVNLLGCALKQALQRIEKLEEQINK